MGKGFLSNQNMETQLLHSTLYLTFTARPSSLLKKPPKRKAKSATVEIHAKTLGLKVLPEV